jgi:hypothetical protein
MKKEREHLANERWVPPKKVNKKEKKRDVCFVYSAA